MIERTTCMNILQTINSEKKHHFSNFLLIFDLDDTILDTFPRRLFIYKNYLKTQFQLPEIDTLSQRNHYNLMSDLKNNVNYEDIISEIMNYYLRLFLSGSLLYLDYPFLGVLNFFKRLSELEVQMIFLTGRYENTMKKATCEILTHYRLFPRLDYEKNLFMKKNSKISDCLFKKLELNRIMDSFPEEKIIIFDNESENCKVFGEILPKDALIIRFNSLQQKSCNFDGFLLENWIL